MLVGNVKMCKYPFREAHFCVLRMFSSKFLCSYMQIRQVVNLEDLKLAEALVAAVQTTSKQLVKSKRITRLNGK